MGVGSGHVKIWKPMSPCPLHSGLGFEHTVMTSVTYLTADKPWLRAAPVLTNILLAPKDKGPCGEVGVGASILPFSASSKPYTVEHLLYHK